jgi:hypothetical protein
MRCHVRRAPRGTDTSVADEIIGAANAVTAVCSTSTEDVQESPSFSEPELKGVRTEIRIDKPHERMQFKSGGRWSCSGRNLETLHKKIEATLADAVRTKGLFQQLLKSAMTTVQPDTGEKVLVLWIVAFLSSQTVLQSARSQQIRTVCTRTFPSSKRRNWSHNALHRLPGEHNYNQRISN